MRANGVELVCENDGITDQSVKCKVCINATTSKREIAIEIWKSSSMIWNQTKPLERE